MPWLNQRSSLQEPGGPELELYAGNLSMPTFADHSWEMSTNPKRQVQIGALWSLRVLTMEHATAQRSTEGANSHEGPRLDWLGRDGKMHLLAG